MPASFDQVERRVLAGQGDLVVTEHAVARWRLRVDSEMPRRKVAAYLQEAWRRKDRVFLAGRGDGGLLYRIGNALVVIQWSMGHPHAVTVLGPAVPQRMSGRGLGENGTRRYS